MYQIRNTVYSEPGYILIGNNKKGYQFNGQPSDFTEEQLTLDDMVISGECAKYSGIVQYIGKNPTYETLKCEMIKRRYSNDDQIAIMLNDDKEAYQKMQEWREWSSKVSKKIMEIKNGNS